MNILIINATLLLLCTAIGDWLIDAIKERLSLGKPTFAAVYLKCCVSSENFLVAKTVRLLQSGFACEF